MGMNIPTPGSVLNASQLTQIFQCSGQGGMRRSLKTNTLLIISKHFDKQYEDRWQGDILHYTGMGLTGDQDLNYSQNKTLLHHDKFGVSVHLFEQFKVGKYHYQGEIELVGNPYQETQSDKNGEDRKVWMFPLQLKAGDPIPEPQNQYLERRENKESKAFTLSNYQLRMKVKKSRVHSGRKRVLGYQNERDAYVNAYTKRRASGICDLCDKPAPFNKKNGEPYLESHHIIWLSNGGEDSIKNTVALCPNCHRKMHTLNLNKDVKKLKIKATYEL